MDSVYQHAAAPVNAHTVQHRVRMPPGCAKIPTNSGGVEEDGALVTVTPAEPVTEAQHARYRRMVAVATALVTTGGEDGLQMSDMPSLAEVSLATLYRYFPSKEHLLFAVVQQYLESALVRAHPSQRGGLTVRDRVANHLLRAFEFDQRVQTLAGVVQRLSRLSDPAFRIPRERVGQLQVDIVMRAAGPMSEHQEQVLWVVLATFGAAIDGWLVGSLPPSQVRFAVMTACRLLDLSPQEIAADGKAADPRPR
jgi:TetR/AcrR family transcriptional regulator, cholesterol catabolism regulator